MSNVNFRCGNCGGLLAVGAQYLGAQVRCPHCQQVVVAPTSSAPMPPSVPSPPPLESTVAFQPQKPPEEMESIFTAPTQTDDLFGPASSPRLQFPPEPQAATINLDPPAQSPAADMAGTLTYTPPQPATESAPVEGATAYVEQPAPASAPWSPGGFASPDQSPVASDVPNDAATDAMLAKKRSRSGWHIPLFIVPLFSYAVLATILAAIFWSRLNNKQPHPLENMPDLDGEHPTNKSGRIAVPRPKTTMDLPRKLKLGESFDLGELRVKAINVEYATISMREGRKGTPEPVDGRCLKLNLEFTNLSKDLAFYPMDRFFTRFWIPGGGKTRDGLPRWMPPDREPYTYLEVGRRRFYGGPAAYAPPNEKNSPLDEYIEGQEFDTILEPGGKSFKTFVCTDPQDVDVAKAVAGAGPEPMLWRVQVRRGTVVVNERRIPATAVIGVEFRRNEIEGKDG